MARRTCGSCGVVDESVCARCSKEHSGWIPKKVDRVALGERLAQSDWFQLLNPRTGLFVKVRLSDGKVIHKLTKGKFKNIPLYVRDESELELEAVVRDYFPDSMVDNILGKVKVDLSGDINE